MSFLALLCHTRHCCVVFVSFLSLPCRYCHCYVTSVIAVSFLSLFCHSSHHCVVIVVSVLFPSSLCRFFIGVSFPSLLCRCVIVLSFLCNFCESLLEDRKLQMTHRRMRPFQNKVLDINIRTHKGLEKDAYFTGEYKTGRHFQVHPFFRPPTYRISLQSNDLLCKVHVVRHTETLILQTNDLLCKVHVVQHTET